MLKTGLYVFRNEFIYKRDPKSNKTFFAFIFPERTLKEESNMFLEFQKLSIYTHTKYMLKLA